MVVRDILDPEDEGYPFEEAFYKNPLVVYHGTRSSYSAVIDVDGFQCGSFPFKLEDIGQLMSAHKAVGFEPGNGGYWGLQQYSRWGQIDNRAAWCVYLSQNFWFAKNYAINIGGETVQQALQAAHKFLAFVTDHAARQRRLKQLERQRVKQLSHDLLQQQMHNLQDPHVLDRLQHQVCQLQNRWHALTEGGYPVVYAIIVDQEWFRQSPELCWSPRGYGPFRMPEDTNLECQQSISPERIVAKVQYVKGTQCGYHLPSPSRWEVARRPRIS